MLMLSRRHGLKVGSHIKTAGLYRVQSKRLGRGALRIYHAWRDLDNLVVAALCIHGSGSDKLNRDRSGDSL